MRILYMNRYNSEYTHNLDFFRKSDLSLKIKYPVLK